MLVNFRLWSATYARPRNLLVSRLMISFWREISFWTQRHELMNYETFMLRSSNIGLEL